MNEFKFKVNLIDYSTGCICQKGFDHRPAISEIKKLRATVKRRKGYKDVKFFNYEIMEKTSDKYDDLNNFTIIKVGKFL